MQIETKVFERVNRESKVAAIAAIADVMQQTVRFGSFNREYVEECAKEFFNDTLKKLRRRTTRVLRKM